MRTSTVRSCEVGNSGRQGTQEGTLVETFETTTTRTRVFRGMSHNLESDTTTEDRQLISSEFEASGNCKNIPGPQ